jgi:hypothetical protein
MGTHQLPRCWAQTTSAGELTWRCLVLPGPSLRKQRKLIGFGNLCRQNSTWIGTAERLFQGGRHNCLHSLGEASRTLGVHARRMLREARRLGAPSRKPPSFFEAFSVLVIPIVQNCVAIDRNLKRWMIAPINFFRRNSTDFSPLRRRRSEMSVFRPGQSFATALS